MLKEIRAKDVLLGDTFSSDGGLVIDVKNKIEITVVCHGIEKKEVFDPNDPVYLWVTNG